MIPVDGNFSFQPIMGIWSIDIEGDSSGQPIKGVWSIPIDESLSVQPIKGVLWLCMKPFTRKNIQTNEKFYNW